MKLLTHKRWRDIKFQILRFTLEKLLKLFPHHLIVPGVIFGGFDDHQNCC